MEARGNNVRLQHLTPIRSGQSLAEIAVALVKNVDAAPEQRADQQGRTVACSWVDCPIAERWDV